jgi:hypothetical protein
MEKTSEVSEAEKKKLRDAFPDRDIADRFFEKESECEYKCVICKRSKKKSGSSWKNLGSHFKEQHVVELDVFIASKKTGQARISDMMNIPTKKQTSIYEWIDWLVTDNLPISIVESNRFRKYAKMEPISTKTATDAIDGLAASVQTKIKEQLPAAFGLMFDGWSEGTRHAVCVFAVYSVDGIRHTPMISFGPLLVDDSFTAEDHLDYFSDLLEFYGKDWSNVLFFVGDNCSTNTKIADKAKKPLIGCACHRLNRAVQLILEEPANSEIILKVLALVKTLRKLKGHGKLLKAGAELKAIGRDHLTRWNGNYEMLLRYQYLREYLAPDEKYWKKLLLSPAQDEDVDTLCKKLGDFSDVCTAMQTADQEAMTLSDVRTIFDQLIVDYPEVEVKLGAHAAIVHSPWFESAVVKILRGQEAELDDEKEKPLMTAYEYEGSISQDASSPEKASTSYVKRALEASKRQRISSEPQYMSLTFLPATSTQPERAFSRAKLTTGLLRQSLSEDRLEALMLLYSNRSLWSVTDVVKVFNEKKDKATPNSSSSEKSKNVTVDVDEDDE